MKYIFIALASIWLVHHVIVIPFRVVLVIDFNRRFFCQHVVLGSTSLFGQRDGDFKSIDLFLHFM